jgi:GMP synthase-like glutamine amidotransferase
MGDVKIAVMKLCILDNDVLDPEMAPVYGSYAAMTERLLRQAGAQGDMDVFHPFHGHYPSDWDAYDAVLLTGSRADAFSDAPWVVNLRAQVTQLLAAHKKLVGICFGHQLIALCLGATVGRAPQGWCMGRMTYTWLDDPVQTLSLLASHQDQVFSLPPGAQLLASHAQCPVAAFRVQDRVWCVQPHPEFVPDYSAFLLHKRRAHLGEQAFRMGMDSLSPDHDGMVVGREIVRFMG